MAGEINPLAAHQLPSFITPPGETDTLMVVMAVFLILMVVLVGIFYLVLHSLPERMSHKANKIQMEVVAVLGLLALFTHNHTFWIIALLLAFVRIPDFETPLYAIADAVTKLAGGERRVGLAPVDAAAEAPPPEPPKPADLPVVDAKAQAIEEKGA